MDAAKNCRKRKYYESLARRWTDHPSHRDTQQKHGHSNTACSCHLNKRVISVSTLLVFRSAQGGVCAQLLFLFKWCKLICVLLCVMPSHILYRRPATAVPSSVPGSYGKPASGSARTEDAGGAAGSRALVTVHRVAEHSSMGHSVECTWQRGESESMDVWARGVFCRGGRSRPRTPVHKGPLRLPRRRPRLALPGVARGSAR